MNLDIGKSMEKSGKVHSVENELSRLGTRGLLNY